MSCQKAVYQWTEVVTTHLPHLSKPQATVLAVWSLGMVVARSCALTAVASLVATWQERKVNSVRQQLREFCYEAEAKRGQHRQELRVESCFAPLLGWVLSWWEGQQLAVAVDATALGARFVVLTVSVVYRGCAIPVAWTVLPGNTKHAWRGEWLRMLRQVRPAVPPTMTVIVLADRGLYARWLYRRIIRLGWHPFVRIKAGGTFRPLDANRFQSLQTRLAAVERQVAELQRKLDEQQRTEQRQAAPFRRRHHKPKPKKAGRAKGHPAAQRERPDHIDQVVEVPLESCPICQTPLVDTVVQEQFQVDLPPIHPQVTQFNLHSGYCPRCRKRVHGRDPQQTSAAVGAAGTQIGPGLLSMAAELKHRLGVPYRKICDFFATYLDISLCPATLVRAEQRLVAGALPSYQLLIDALRECHVVHADETGWRIDRVNVWLWVFSSSTVTVYVIEASRGHEVPEAILGPEFEGVLVVDGLKSYDVLAYQKGRCVGHVLRRTSYLAETLTGTDQYYVEELHGLLRQALALAKRRERLTESGYWRQVQQVEERLDVWLVWHGAEPGEAVQRLARHVAAHREEWFRFLYDPEVPATNNHAERMLRPAVICRKIGGCNKSLLGAVVHGVLASLAVSCKQQGKRFVDLARSLFRSPVPQAISLAGLPDG